MADTPASSVGALGGNAPGVCSECGKSLAESDLIRHGHLLICANCKPVFLQKLAEGARIDARALRYAGFGVRFGAVFLDGIIILSIWFILFLGLGWAFNSTLKKGPSESFELLSDLLFYGLFISYETVFVGACGATPGKLACGIKVVTPDGGRVTYRRALGRYLAKLLSAIILYIGFIMAGFDSEKRALHDRLCHTRVIYK